MALLHLIVAIGRFLYVTCYLSLAICHLLSVNYLLYVTCFLILFAGAACRAGPDSMLILCVSVWDNFKASDWSKFGDLARRRETSHDIARLILMLPLEPWRNSTPFFGAAAFCTTKNGDFRTSSTLSSLTTWLRRPLRKDQLGGTKGRYSPYV